MLSKKFGALVARFSPSSSGGLGWLTDDAGEPLQKIYFDRAEL
jgi:hypothetical protein